jgi:heterodisulfide reductase subunit A-like polyferredoxin
MAASPADKRVSSFMEVGLGFSEEEAKAEASRCLACGICSECLSCYYKCGLNAINHDMVETQEEVKVGSVILAPGYEVYNARLSQEYGLGRYPNVLNALQFERILSASGPTLGHVQRPSDKKVPEDRLPAVRGEPRPTPSLLLGGLLHVRHQGSDHRQGARKGSRAHHLFHRCARLRKRV